MKNAMDPEKNGTRVAQRLADLDAELRHLVLGDAQLRLRIGELLHALFRSAGHRDLGFSSIDAYVQERCRQSRWWGRDTRALARRLEEKGLTELRAALRSGRLSWCMADLLSRHVGPEDEGERIREASSETFRSMQVKLTDRSVPSSPEDSEPVVHPTRWLSETELRLIGLSRMLVDYLSGAPASDEMLFTALLGEAETSLQAFEGWESRGTSATVGHDMGQPALPAHLALAASTLSALHVLAREPSDRRVEPAGAKRMAALEDRPDAPLPTGALALDRAIVEACRELAGRSIRLGDLARRVIAARMWRRLGFSSPAAYAEEHLGLSLSALEHYATFARRLSWHPLLREAVGDGRLGTEAAQLLGRILPRGCEPELTEAWIARAQVRTYKHLREEVNAVLLGLSLDPSRSPSPPSSEELESLAELERKVQSGEVFRSLLGAHATGPQTFVTLAPESSPTVRPMKLHLPCELHQYWLDLERRFHQFSGRKSSFIGFMCASLWTTWLPFLETRSDKWGSVYLRDRHRCSNPVCSRRDITPHHVVFQSDGGGDEDDNMASLCSWCHLDGVHEGRIAVEHGDEGLVWRVGPPGFLGVEGRTVVARA